jgi:hypothetical protein
VISKILSLTAILAIIGLVSISILSLGCSTRIDHADIANKELMIIDRIQKLPTNPIDGVTYSMQNNGLNRPQTVGVTKFSFVGVDYRISTFAAENPDKSFRFYIDFHVEDKEKIVICSEMGNDRLQPMLGSIDGNLDGGEIDPKIKNGYSGIYNRFYQESDVKQELEKYEVQIIETTLKVLKLK